MNIYRLRIVFCVLRIQECVEGKDHGIKALHLWLDASVDQYSGSTLDWHLNHYWLDT